MRKHNQKVKQTKMRNIFRLLIGLISLLTILTVFSAPVLAQRGMDRPVMEYDVGLNTGGGSKKVSIQGKENAISIVKETWTKIFGTKSPTGTTPLTPNNGTTTTPAPSVIPLTGTPYEGNFKTYKQCDYASVVAVTEGTKTCSLCNMGCGITSAAMILATLVDQNIDPKFVMNKYKAKGEYMTCYGTDIKAAKNIMKENNLVTSEYLFNYGRGQGANVKTIADDITPYLKSGWFVFVLAEFKPNGGGGHFFVLTDINLDQRTGEYTVTSMDPYYEPDSRALPINYNKRKPYPLYRAAFAVKKP